MYVKTFHQHQHNMEELIADVYLTQNEDIPIENRLLFKKVITFNSQLFREATQEEILQINEYNKNLII